MPKPMLTPMWTMVDIIAIVGMNWHDYFVLGVSAITGIILLV